MTDPLEAAEAVVERGLQEFARACALAHLTRQAEKAAAQLRLSRADMRDEQDRAASAGADPFEPETWQYATQRRWHTAYGRAKAAQLTLRGINDSIEDLGGERVEEGA